MSDKSETIADIVREMRDDVRTSRVNNPDPWARIFLSASNRAIGEYADRLEKALRNLRAENKREEYKDFLYL